MKRKIQIILVTSILALNTQSHAMLNNWIGKSKQNNAPTSTDSHKDVDYLKPFIVEASGGFFSPSSCILEEIYGNVWGAFQFKLSVAPFENYDYWDKLYLFTAVNYTAKSGSSLLGRQHTKIHLIPLSFGLRFIQPIEALKNRMSLYLGLGAQASLVRTTNNPLYVDEHAKKNGPGGYVEVGSYFHPCEWGLVSLGFDYSFAKLSRYKPNKENVIGFKLKTSGFSFRVGLGGTF